MEEEEEGSLSHYPNHSKGMESVVATVSGYHGSERFKLIKLISQSGASYVGTMNRFTTHLVCWKFEGRKYELAKKFNMFIVNHRWVEECLKRGRRVPEHNYVFQSGQEVGPFVLDVLPLQYDSHKTSKRPVLDMELGEDSHLIGTRSRLLDEDMSLKCGARNNSHHLNKKAGRRFQNLVCSTSRCNQIPNRHEHEIDEQIFSHPMPSARERRRRSTAEESVPKKHRLVKQNVIDLDSEDSIPISITDHFSGLRTRLNDSYSKRDKMRFRVTGISDDEFGCGDNTEENSQDMAHIHTPEDLEKQSGNVLNPAERNSVDSSCNEGWSNEGSEQLARSTGSTELSCVICWTDFSSTRGVLPCGHRFCFSCIQSWADVMASRGKASTCPLCKASFISITKVDGAASFDQKIFSQTMPCDPSVSDIFILPGGERRNYAPQPEPTPVCSECCFREPEDLLVKCNLCQIRCIHSYCLDPPLLPWTCIHCKDLQMMYRHPY